MRKLSKLMFWSLVALLAGMTACAPDVVEEEVPKKDPLAEASLSARIISVGINTANGAFSTEVLTEVYYVVETTASAKDLAAEDIIAEGVCVECSESGATRFVLEGLNDNTEYTLQVAGKLVTEENGLPAEYIFDEVFQTTFTTSVRPTLTATLIDGSLTANSARVNVNIANIARIAYLVYPAEEVAAENFTTPVPAVIFAEGVITDQITFGNNEIAIQHLAVNTEYVMFIAGEQAETQDFYPEVVKVEGIKTIDFSENLRVYDIGYNTFKLDVKAPDNLGDHVIKWATCDIYTYNLNIVYGGLSGRPSSMAEAMNLNDDVYGNYFNKSTTFTFDEAHSYIEGETEDDILLYYNALVPGQPQVVMLGEYRWGESQVGWGMGYYTPLFDFDYYQFDLENARTEEAMYEIARNEGKYWEEGAFFHKLDVQLKKPELLTKEIKVEVEPRPDGAAMKFEIEEGLDAFIIFIENNEIHSHLVNIFNGEANFQEHIQWWITSYTAMLEGAVSFTRALNFPDGKMTVELGQFFYEHAITRDDTYTLHVVGVHDDEITNGFMDGHIQSYQTKSFQLPQSTLPDPEFELVYVPAKSDSTKAVFNLKNANPSGCEITKAYYVANSERAWHQITGSCQALLDEYGAPLQGVEISAINTADGLDITVPAIPNERIYMAVKVANADGTRVYSLDPVISDVIMKETTTTDLSKINALAGEWTAKATIGYNEIQKDEDGNTIYENVNGEQVEKTVWVTKDVECKINIGEKVEYPATLPESVYTIYQNAGVSRELTDAYFSEFKTAADAFNQNVTNHNQVMCTGWGFDTTGYINATYADAYELFSSADYQGAYSVAPIYDFGPKWYIETDGTDVWVPFNTNYYVPLSSWTTTVSYAIVWNEYQLIGNSGTSTIGYGGIDESLQSYQVGYYKDGKFPVEISADGNTITIKPMVLTAEITNTDGSITTKQESFYPCAGHNFSNNGTYYFMSRIVSDIVMTRGYTASAAQQARVAAPAAGKNRIVLNKQKAIQEIKPVQKPKSLTPFVGMGVPTYEYNIPTSEEFHQRNIDYLNKIKGLQ